MQEKRLERMKWTKRGDRQEAGWGVSTASPNLGTVQPSGQHLPLGGDFRLGP